LVVMEMARRQLTNVCAPTDAGRAPVNQFGHIRTPLIRDARRVMRPNADTLVSSAWLDLRWEPLVVHLPNTHGRSYWLEMLNAWTEVFATPSARTTDTVGVAMVLIGPGWNGAVPAGLPTIRAPTNIVWIIACLQTCGVADDGALYPIHAGPRLTPLSAWGTGPYTPPAVVPVDPTVDPTTPPLSQVAAMDAGTFFGILAGLLRDNAPQPEDAAMVATLARIGLVPGQPFRPRGLAPALRSALDRAVAAAHQMIQATRRVAGGGEDPASRPQHRGRQGPNYLKRASAATAMFALAEIAVVRPVRHDADTPRPHRWVWPRY
jgi:hypothetical protein